MLREMYVLMGTHMGERTQLRLPWKVGQDGTSRIPTVCFMSLIEI